MAKAIPVAGYVLQGKVGEVVFCKRGDTCYARARVVPRNPKSPAQNAKRERFRQAVLAWRALPDADKQAYAKRASFLRRTGYNLFIAEFLQAAAGSGPGGGP
jgi:hypothetical protein